MPGDDGFMMRLPLLFEHVIEERCRVYPDPDLDVRVGRWRFNRGSSTREVEESLLQAMYYHLDCTTLDPRIVPVCEMTTLDPTSREQKAWNFMMVLGEMGVELLGKCTVLYSRYDDEMRNSYTRALDWWLGRADRFAWSPLDVEEEPNIDEGGDGGSEWSVGMDDDEVPAELKAIVKRSRKELRVAAKKHTDFRSATYKGIADRLLAVTHTLAAPLPGGKAMRVLVRRAVTMQCLAATLAMTDSIKHFGEAGVPNIESARLIMLELYACQLANFSRGGFAKCADALAVRGITYYCRNLMNLAIRELSAALACAKRRGWYSAGLCGFVKEVGLAEQVRGGINVTTPLEILTRLLLKNARQGRTPQFCRWIKKRVNDEPKERSILTGNFADTPSQMKKKKKKTTKKKKKKKSTGGDDADRFPRRPRFGVASCKDPTSAKLYANLCFHVYTSSTFSFLLINIIVVVITY